MKTKIFTFLIVVVYSLIFVGTVSAVTCETGYTAQSGICVPSGTGLSNASVAEIITNIAGWLASLIGLIAIIGFFISAFMYFTASGDQNMLERAKKAMIASIIGVVVALSGVVILNAVENILNASPDF